MPFVDSVAIVHEAISGGAVFVATLFDIAKNRSFRNIYDTILDSGFLHRLMCLLEWIVLP